MSRLDEALRRAGKTGPSTETFNVPSSRALDWFSPGEQPRAEAAKESGPKAEESRPKSLHHDGDEPARSAALQTRDETPRSAGPQARAYDDARITFVGSASGAFEEKLVISKAMGAVAVEQYRRLAAVLHHAQRERGTKIVMIASAAPAEGKTLTAVNLAFTLGESYRRRVLLIDADLRRPMVHEMLNVRNISGLNDALSAPADGKLSVVTLSSHLSVLPAGRANPDPMSSLTSDRMKRVVAEAAERYDWVILDTPPLALLPDANLLGSMVDAAVLVIGAGRTPLVVVQRAVDAIGKDRILGVVLNRVNERETIAEYGMDGYYYGRYAPAPEKGASA